MSNNKKLYELHAGVCKAIANPKRIEIIYLLMEGEKNVSELAKEMEASAANVSQHLSILKEKKVVCARKEGLNVFYSICDPRMVEALEIMKEVMLEQLSELIDVSQEILAEEK
ncbi:ArsR/SmtB family transcription factor [Fuchsiella alkaliacetigena]|uniref:ArsR/SmtB family transcription factor n=1 Tax=Fuchsiella alkaliacetigena TaxID=957042 RepID=UPI00200A2269|nr:metalloregulator ArsR/SmtB family transcription factor [Fuchsiella alkaliacetigena]MCK8825850.1 metalloregulator ArsR/SmtB family transcription factor [Fuchsiella alkaliacetigena]